MNFQSFDLADKKRVVARFVPLRHAADEVRGGSGNNRKPVKLGKFRRHLFFTSGKVVADACLRLT